MSQPSSEQLQRAYELIQSDDIAKAHAILTRHLANHRDDVDAWWLMVYATEEQSEAERALQNVLRLDPNHEQARALLDEIGGIPETIAELPFKDPSFLDRLDTTTNATVAPHKVPDEYLDDEFDFDDADEDEQLTKPVRSSRRLLTALLAALALVLVVGALLILGTQRGSAPEATQAAVQGTSTAPSIVAPTSDPQITNTAPTESVPSESTVLTTEQAQPFIAELSGVTLISNGLEFVTTSKGQTLSASVCSAPSSRAIRDAVFETMKGLARANASATGLADAIAVKVFNCDGDNALLRFITADLASAKEYADNTIDEAQFASLWSAE